MSIEITSVVDDFVIDSKFITGQTDYGFAVKTLYPLINRLPIQRNLQNPSFYNRLKLDLLRGCVIPPITLAIISDKSVLPNKVAHNLLVDKLSKINSRLYNHKHLPNLCVISGG